MKGPKTKPSEQLAEKQIGWSEEQMRFMREDRARRDTLTQPAVDFYSAIASGDQNKITAAAAPILSQITSGEKTARERVYNEVPRGAGQEFALAQLPIVTAGQTAEAKGGMFLGAFDKLANIGSGYGSFSLAELGAGLRAGEAAGQTYGNVMQAQAAKKQATMGFLGDVARAAGSAAPAFSDRRLKKNIKIIGRQSGYNIYEFSYLWDDPSERFVGVMAQEVLERMPSAVHSVGGWLAVDYGQLGIQFRRVE